MRLPDHSLVNTNKVTVHFNETYLILRYTGSMKRNFKVKALDIFSNPIQRFHIETEEYRLQVGWYFLFFAVGHQIFESQRNRCMYR